MVRLFIFGAAISGIYFYIGGILGDKEPIHVMVDKETPSLMMLELKEYEEWDSNYLLGCHIKKTISDIHFCYEVISQGNINGFQQAFRHGNTLVSKFVSEQDERLLEAAQWVIKKGLENYHTLESECHKPGCSMDIKQHLEDQKYLADEMSARLEEIVNQR